jgi:membrane protease YdiL (CAAX protease family)
MEFVLVLLVAFGMFVPRNLAAVLALQPNAGPTPPINNTNLLGIIVYELAVFAILLPFLRARGWTMERFGIRATVRDSLIGLGLAIVAYFAYVAEYSLVATVWPKVIKAALARDVVASHLSWPIVIVASSINPLWEELFVCGYIVSVVKDRWGPHAAVNASTGIRVFYHAYQGIFGALSVAPFGLVLSYWYLRTGRLWPLIVAHAATDLWGLWSSSTVT